MDRLFEDCALPTTPASRPSQSCAKSLKRCSSSLIKGRLRRRPLIFSPAACSNSVTRDAFVDSIRVLLYVPQAMAAMPLLIHLAAQGNIGPLVSVGFRSTSDYQPALSRDAVSVVCVEDIHSLTMKR